MYLRKCRRKVGGAQKDYWQLVESYRSEAGPRQRVVAHLGDLDEAGRLGVKEAASGNIPSQAFPLDSFQVSDVREMVKVAIQDGAPGGGFTLRTTGGASAGLGKTREQRIKDIECHLAMIDAWREFGSY